MSDVTPSASSESDAVPAPQDQPPTSPATAAGIVFGSTIFANASDEQFDVAAGNAFIVAIGSSDTFVVGQGVGIDWISGFNTANDVVELDNLGFTDFGSITAAMSQVGSSTVLALGNGDFINFVGQQISDFTAADFAVPGGLAVTSSASPAPGPTLAQLEEAQSHMLAPTITNPKGASLVTGTSGNDVIDGGTGAVTMAGGLGTDTYIVRNAADVIIEAANAGIDTVLAYVGYALPANITNLVAMGSVSGSFAGNALNNTIIGNSGTDRIIAGTGNDTLVAGSGNDTFVISKGDGADTIDGFNTAHDVVELDNFGFTGFATIAAAMTQSGGNVVLALGNGESLTLAGHKIADLSAADFSGFVAVSTPPTLAQLEAMQARPPTPTITDPTNASQVTGTSGNDVITGGYGAVTMSGGLGNDIYIVSDEYDTVVEAPNAGTDTILAYCGFTLPANITNLVAMGTASGWLAGNALNDTIIGNAGTDRIIAGTGSDILVAGTGVDTFAITAGDGSDTIMSFNAAQDVVDLEKFDFASFAAITAAMTQSGSNVVLALGGSETVTFTGHVISDFVTTDFLQNDEAFGTSPPPPPATSPPPSTTSPPPPVSPPPAASNDVIETPVVSHNAGDIVGVELQNLTSTSQPGHDITFGQPFVDGDLPAGDTLEAFVNGQAVAVQMDVKTTYADGSVADAVLSLAAPTIAANGSVDVMLAAGPPATSTPAPVAMSSILQHGYDVSLDLTMHNADGSTTPYVIDAATVLSQALQDGTAQTWLQGPLATDVRVETTITGGLQAEFDITAYADGSTSTDVILTNDTVGPNVDTDYTYDAVITQNGQTVFSQSAIDQYHSSTWNEQIYSNGTPSLNIIPDVNYLIATGDVPGYDTTEGVDQSSIAYEESLLTPANTAPMGNALVDVSMPDTGLRADIGPMAEWTALAMLSQDPGADAAMLDSANAAGSAPWHAIDPTTGEPVSIITDPDANLYVTTGSDWLYNPESILPPTARSDTGWDPDAAHQPDLTYYAYLTTGNEYYLDELQSQANWDLLYMNPLYRDFSDGNLMMHGELRAEAWDLRELGEAATITPDSDPMKAYFTGMVENNLSYLVQTYITDNVEGGTAVEGWFPGYPDGGIEDPWMEDFMAISLCQLAEEGFQGASQLALWMVNFEAGRFLNGANGFNPLNGADYEYVMWDPNSTQPDAALAALGITGTLYSTWGQVFTASGLDTEDSTPSVLAYVEDRYALSNTYPAVARAALADLVTVTGSPEAVEAYGVDTAMMAQAGGIAQFQFDPQWDIAPKFADGSYLTDGNIHVVTGSTGTTYAGIASDQMIWDAGTAPASISGGGGVNLLFAGTGGDTLTGTGNINYLFGNTGNDTLVAQAGSNYMMGNGGNDTFVVNAANVGNDTIADFNPANDVLQISGTGGTLLAQTIAASVTSDSTGDAVLHLSATHELTLAHVAPSEVTASLVHVTS